MGSLFPGDAERGLAVAFLRAPAGPLEEQVLDEPAGIVVERAAGILRAPARHQLGTGLVPRHAKDEALDRLPAPAHIADPRPELVGMADVVALVELPQLVSQDIAEDEEPAVADLELGGIAAELDRVRRA